jgi:hypothetical protein
VFDAQEEIQRRLAAGEDARAGPQPMPGLAYLSPKAVVRESPIHGRGLFAREPIARGEIVAIKGGYVFDAATRRAVERELGPAEIAVADGFFIGPRLPDEREGGMIFSNHSCDPTIGVQGQIVFVALREVDAGEELTHDWATTDDDDGEMTCRCGAAACRGTVTGQDWRRPDLQEKYRGYFSWYLQRKIDHGAGSSDHPSPPRPLSSPAASTGGLFAVVRTRGPAWDDAQPLEGQVDWAGHAAFMDALHDEGFAVLVGPLEGTRDALLVVRAAAADEVHARLAADPWTRLDLLRTGRVAPWTLRLGSL